MRNTLDFLERKGGLTRLDAYSLTSIGVSFHVTQVVDANKGAHAIFPKSVFTTFARPCRSCKPAASITSHDNDLEESKLREHNREYVATVRDFAGDIAHQRVGSCPGGNSGHAQHAAAHRHGRPEVGPARTGHIDQMNNRLLASSVQGELDLLGQVGLQDFVTSQ
jgi:hypothetical protein